MSADPDDDECTEFVYTLSLPERLIFTDNWNWGSIETFDSIDGEKSVADIIALQTGLYYNFLYWPATDVVYVTVDEAVCSISSAYGASLASAAE